MHVPMFPGISRTFSFMARPSSVSDMITELREKGILCEPVRTDAYTGKAMTFFRDPDGLPIEIHE